MMKGGTCPRNCEKLSREISAAREGDYNCWHLSPYAWSRAKGKGLWIEGIFGRDIDLVPIGFMIKMQSIAIIRMS